MNYFTDLLAVQCETDKKGKLTYVSWIEAWAQLKQRHPGATYEVHQTPDGRFLHGEGLVMCSVTVPTDDDDVTHTMWLPVMDGRNQAISDPDTTQINKALMRCLAKCVAMHGLGAYVYMGEDLPTVEAPVDYPAKLRALKAWAATETDPDKLHAADMKAGAWPDKFQMEAHEAICERMTVVGVPETT